MGQVKEYRPKYFHVCKYHFKRHTLFFSRLATAWVWVQVKKGKQGWDRPLSSSDKEMESHQARDVFSLKFRIPSSVNNVPMLLSVAYLWENMHWNDVRWSVAASCNYTHSSCTLTRHFPSNYFFYNTLGLLIQNAPWCLVTSHSGLYFQPRFRYRKGVILRKGLFLLNISFTD